MQHLADLSEHAPAIAHIFVVDLCPYFIDGLTSTLTEAGYEISGHATSHDALDQHKLSLDGSNPLACIIGPNLRTFHAFDACRWFRAHVSHAVVMFISQHADDAIFQADAAHCGALACLPVGAPSETLLSALPLVLNGQSLIPPEFQKLEVEPLTRREWEVLRLIAEGKAMAEIAAELFVSKGTADKHKQSIFRKIRVHRKEDAIRRAQHLGWLPCD
jgi:DNA-binding NarL/FixJ family response regulator